MVDIKLRWIYILLHTLGYLCLSTYISANPINILQNIFGGGDVQRDNIAIANLEVRSAELEAYRANLNRRQAEVRSELREEVFGLLLEYEAAEREYILYQFTLTLLRMNSTKLNAAFV